VSERLAIDGGTPVRPTLLPYGRQQIDAADIAAVVDALESDYLTTGPAIERFEQAFADYVGARHAVAVSSGTAALHAAAYAAGIGPRHRVITTPLTFVATANCVRYQGGTPVFVDVRPDTLTIDNAQVISAMRREVKAVIAVDYAGVPSDLDELAATCADFDAVLIEDASHALGATYRGRPVGSVAHLTTFSLHPVKHITTGEGGLVTTNDDALAARMRRFRNHGITLTATQRARERSWEYDVEDIGFNYRLTDVQCALGLSQLAKLDGWVRRRRAIASMYDTELARLSQVELPVRITDRESSWHLFVIRLRLDRLRVGRREVFAALRAENIGVNVHYVPVPWHSAFKDVPGCGRGYWPVTEAAYERMITLPLWPGMTDADACDVVRAVSKVISAYAA
jgi:perosamine synthetase